MTITNLKLDIFPLLSEQAQSGPRPQINPVKLTCTTATKIEEVADLRSTHMSQPQIKFLRRTRDILETKSKAEDNYRYKVLLHQLITLERGYVLKAVNSIIQAQAIGGKVGKEQALAFLLKFKNLTDSEIISIFEKIAKKYHCSVSEPAKHGNSSIVLLPLSVERPIKIMKPLSLATPSVFSPTFCRAIRTQILPNGELRADVSMGFPWVGTRNCEMTIEVTQSGVINLAMALFKVGITCKDNSVVIEHGYNATKKPCSSNTTSLDLRGPLDVEGRNAIFGSYFFPVTTSSVHGTDHAKPPINHVAMTIARDCSEAVVGLSLSLDTGVRICRDLFF